MTQADIPCTGSRVLLDAAPGKLFNAKDAPTSPGCPPQEPPAVSRLLWDQLPTGSVRSGDFPFPLADCNEKRMFTRLKVVFELWSSSAM